MSRAIHILAGGGSSLARRDLEGIARTMAGIFPLPVRLLPSTLNADRAYDPARGQWNSTALLAQILETTDAGNGKFIGVVDVDLFIPVLTFVFGEAQLDGSAAIVSTQRLRNRFYGLPDDRTLLLERLAKEIIHELGHTFGLLHCRQFECVMRSSTAVEEIDLKAPGLCETCRGVLARKVASFS